MSPEAPTRLDRALLRCVSGTLGHLVGTAIEVAAAIRAHRGMRREERRSVVP